MTKALLVSIEGGVATLTLNRPAAGNALDMTLARALLDAAIQCDQDETIRCVVLTGAGRLFCAGGDIAAFVKAGAAMSAFLSELAGILHMAMTRLMRMPKSLLVVVNGPAAGAGLSLASAGDIVLAARSAHFSAGYVSIGLSPDVGTSWHLPRLIGVRRTQEMLLTNRRVPASEAEAIGLVTRTVDDAELDAERKRYESLLVEAPVGAIGLTRNLLVESLNSSLEQQLEREVRSMVAASRSTDCHEGIQAFLEKRKPNFRKEGEA